MLTAPEEAILEPIVGAGPTSNLRAMPEERRVVGRIRAKVTTELIPIDGSGALRGMATDIGAGGLFIQVPVESALAVGQRYEVVLPDDDADAVGLSRFVGEACYATVVRTGPGGRETSPTIGAGLRFDHPLMFWERESI